MLHVTIRNAIFVVTYFRWHVTNKLGNIHCTAKPLRGKKILVGGGGEWQSIVGVVLLRGMSGIDLTPSPHPFVVVENNRVVS